MLCFYHPVPYTTGRKIAESVSIAILFAIFLFQVIFPQFLTGFLIVLNGHKSFVIIGSTISLTSICLFIISLMFIFDLFESLEASIRGDEMEHREFLLQLDIVAYKHPMEDESTMIEELRSNSL